jgi:hypothetical protein
MVQGKFDAYKEFYMEDAIRVSALKKYFDDFPAVNDIEFGVKEANSGYPDYCSR